jgi:putative nucleotidyltransferase with HDIG domain
MTSRRPNIYIGVVMAAGAAILIQGLSHWESHGWPRYLSYCAIALIASALKVTLPAVKGAMSTSFLFVLIGISQLSLAETLAMGCLGMLVQSSFRSRAKGAARTAIHGQEMITRHFTWRELFQKHHRRLVQMAFNVASLACSIRVSYDVYRAPLLEAGSLEAPLRLLLAATAFFVTNTLSVATVISLTENQRTWAVWRDSYFWSFPNYLAGAAVAWIVDVTARLGGWQASLLLLPVLYFVYRSHNLYVSRLEEEKMRAEEQRAYAEQQRAHAEEVAALHRRTIETLAIAIEAKDQTTADHLERVEVYAIEVAKQLGLSETELQALRASALLHDVGKLAVPEYIISKPGRLTPDEFEKMKTHTVVGAEIVERIQFPYPVAPIVRSHHEKWDGSGYPDGLSGEQIPIGARILSAVDCLDALASDRQYRRALPLHEAIKVVESEAGKSFDPQVVEVLAKRYVELERMARASAGPGKMKLSTGVKIERGQAPAAGFEATANLDLVNFQRSLAAEENQSRQLAEMPAELDLCADPEGVFAILRSALREIVAYEAMVVYIRRGERLIAESVDGEDYRLFASLEIPMGMGLSGWVAENRKAIVNGNPSVEPGYLSDPTKFSMLRSALAVPLVHNGGVFGVLSLYRLERDAFTQNDLALLLSVGTALGRCGHLFGELAAESVHGSSRRL